MHSNPFTPPNESTHTFSAGTNPGVVAGAAVNVAYYASQQFASPISNVHMGFDEKPDLGDRAEAQDVSDGEEGKSDGGVPLEMAHPPAEEMDIELDTPDIQMNQDTFDEVLVAEHFPTTLEDAFPGSPSFQQPQPQDPDTFDFTDDLPNPTHSDMPPVAWSAVNMAHAYDLPNTVSIVSLELQHVQVQLEDNIQGGQGHAEPGAEAEAPAHMENSTTPISYQFHIPMGIVASSGTSHSGSYVSLPEPATFSNTQALAGGHSVLNTLSISDSAVLQDTRAPPLSTQSNFLHVADDPYPHIEWDLLGDNISDIESQDEADNGEVTQPNNHHLIEFLHIWNNQYRPGGLVHRPRGHAITALIPPRFVKLPPIRRRDLRGEECDVQGINWTDLGVTRLEARQMRRQTYINYTSIAQNDTYSFPARGVGLCDDQNFFRFRKMDFEHNIRLSHFQLRNLVVCTSRDHIFYAGPAKVLHCNPQSNKKSTRATVAMDLSDPLVHSYHSVSGQWQITALAQGHDVLVAGGYDGEYSLMNVKAPKNTRHIEGLVTDHQNSITNHVQVHLSRGSSLPLATFASNDQGVRILDINTNTFIAEHNYPYAINCTAISPDQRLRVLVGDTRRVMICNAATGEVLQSLEGHRDYGFACDWADDGWTVATGNQDKQVKIWDARKWTNSAGIAQPVATIPATMAGVRKLKFSPLGSGKRVLVAAEPADIIDVIDGETFASKQTLSFFGEIGGFDFTNNGQDLIVANCDPSRGGLMAFERCDSTSGMTYLEDYKEINFRSRVVGRANGYHGYDRGDTEGNPMAQAKSGGTDEQRRKRPANLSISMGLF